MKKVLRKKYGKLSSVYSWAVDYSLKKTKELRQTRKKKPCAETTTSKKTG